MTTIEIDETHLMLCAIAYDLGFEDGDTENSKQNRNEMFKIVIKHLKQLGKQKAELEE